VGLNGTDDNDLVSIHPCLIDIHLGSIGTFSEKDHIFGLFGVVDNDIIFNFFIEISKDLKVLLMARPPVGTRCNDKLHRNKGDPVVNHFQDLLCGGWPGCIIYNDKKIFGAGQKILEVRAVDRRIQGLFHEKSLFPDLNLVGLKKDRLKIIADNYCLFSLFSVGHAYLHGSFLICRLGVQACSMFP